jgi:uncharacterized protein YndB with AHSA1/START domain/DNA-binding transcriptional ArsR family regulator
METDEVFKALADPHRRTLLDALFQRDGQTLGELCDYLPMTRYGVMKHLQVLEDAGLLTTRKAGREKYHYLNPIPIQEVYDRWVSKYSQPWAQSLTQLKFALESDFMTAKPIHQMQIFIRTSPEKLWTALTDGRLTEQYYMQTRVESTWQPGAPYHYYTRDGGVMIDGVVEKSEPPRRLVTTFNALWMPESERGETTRVTFEIEPVGAACKLTMTHEGLTPDAPLTLGIRTGWAQILSSLKSLLETGEPLELGA